jgi:hypothetical protein
MSRDRYDVLNSIPGSLSEGVSYRRTSYIAEGTVRGNQYSLGGVTINDPFVMHPMTNINIVTRSGGNEFHGAATAEFYTNRIQNYLDVTSTTKWDKEMGHAISSQLNWVFMQNLFIDARLGYIARDFPIPYSDYAIADAPSLYDRYYGIYRNNLRFEETYIRHRFNPSVVATIFQEDLFGASHEIKIGAEYEYTDGYVDIINALGRSRYQISSNPSGTVDYSDPANPTFTRYGDYGNIDEAFKNRVFKVSISFTF